MDSLETGGSPSGSKCVVPIATDVSGDGLAHLSVTITALGTGLQNGHRPQPLLRRVSLTPITTAEATDSHAAHPNANARWTRRIGRA